MSTDSWFDVRNDAQRRVYGAGGDTFIIDPVQRAKVVAWLATLPPEPRTVVGGRLEYRIVPTSIGDFISVHDGISGQTLDLNDYESF